MPTATKTKHTARHHADAPAEPPAPHRAVNAHWMFDGWKGALNRATPDERVRTAIVTDVNRAATDATHRRAVGQPGKAHPLAQIGRVVSGLSSRAQRASREPIRAGELAEIERSLRGLDELAGVYEVSAAASARMVADARRSIAGADGDDEDLRPFGDSTLHLTRACDELGLASALAAKARQSAEVIGITRRLEPLHGKFRRLPRDEAGRLVMPPGEGGFIEGELGLVEQDALKLQALADASRAMVLEARTNLGLELPVTRAEDPDA
jgi:hypothetical protein